MALFPDDSGAHLEVGELVVQMILRVPENMLQHVASIAHSPITLAVE